MNQTLKMLLFTVLLSALGFGFLFLTGQKFDFSGFGALVKLEPLYVVLVPVTLLGWWVVAGWRIQLIANSPQVTLSRGIRALLLSLYGAAVTPGATGANVALAWFLSRYTDPKRATATAIFTLSLDMVYFAWSLPLCFIILELRGVDLKLPIIGPILGVIVALGAIIAGGLAWGLTYQTKRLEGLIWWVTGLRFLQRFRRGALRFIRETADAIHEIRTLPPARQFLLHFSTTLGFLLHFGVANMVVQGLGLPVDHVNLLAMQSIIVAMTFVVPLPGATGFVEVALGSSVQGAGLPDSAVTPFVLIWRFLSYYLYFFIGPFIGGPALLNAASRKPAPSDAPSSEAGTA